MSGVLNTRNVSSRNEALTRPSPDMKDQNSSKQKTTEDNHVQILPGSKFSVSKRSAFHVIQSAIQDSSKNHVLAADQGHKFTGDASVVDAEKCSGGGDVAQMETQLSSKFSVSKRSAFHVIQSAKQDSGKNHMLDSDQGHKFMGDASGVDSEKCSGGGDVAEMETQLKEKLPSSSGVVDLKCVVPDLNVTNPEVETEPVSSRDDDKRSTFRSVSSSMADLKVVVKIIREMEIKGHLKTEFRLKFLTWYSLRAKEEEREVVCAYMRDK